MSGREVRRTLAMPARVARRRFGRVWQVDGVQRSRIAEYRNDGYRRRDQRTSLMGKTV